MFSISIMISFLGVLSVFLKMFHVIWAYAYHRGCAASWYCLLIYIH
jgi:hypothetical protein